MRRGFCVPERMKARRLRGLGLHADRRGLSGSWYKIGMMGESWHTRLKFNFSAIFEFSGISSFKAFGVVNPGPYYKRNNK
jgi:hypothetical protein